MEAYAATTVTTILSTFDQIMIILYNSLITRLKKFAQISWKKINISTALLTFFFITTTSFTIQNTKYIT